MKRVASVLLLLAACDEPFEPKPKPDGSVTPGDCDVPALFASTCVAGCHDTATKQAGLDLEAPGLASRVYGVRATGRADYLLVDPELPEESALVVKLSATPPFGTRMPNTGSPLDAQQRACVQAWVNALVDAGPGDGGSVVTPVDGGGGGDAGVDGGTFTPVDGGTFDAGRFWGPVADSSGCVPDGGAWCIAQRVPEPLYAVRGLSETDIWAVGSRGAAYHYDGNTWSRSDAGVSVTLFDVHPVSATDVWAVGEQGTVLRHQGGAWARVPWSPPMPFVDAGLSASGAPPRDLGGVWATATEAWISGAGDTLAQWNGSTLRVTQSASPNELAPDLLKIWRRGPTEWWAAGDMAFRENNGTGWAQGRGAIQRVFGIWGAVNPMNMARVLVAVGADGSMLSYSYTDSGQYPWQPPSWNPDALELRRDLRSVWLDAATARGWTVGLDGQIVEVNMVTSRYVRHVTPVGDHLLGVWGTAPNRSWAVGGRVDGVILRSR
ncbi:MAG: hypothetical protein JNK82_00885 [Myxococcaceae bacterium]|nr:hypothetical protein [Myxococcaceae bacterium]